MLKRGRDKSFDILKFNTLTEFERKLENNRLSQLAQYVINNDSGLKAFKTEISKVLANIKRTTTST